MRKKIATKRSKRVSPTPWLGLPKDFDPLPYHGFVYLIENLLTGRKYIGRKYFWSTRKEPKKKNSKRRKRVTKESDWRTYKSSSNELKKDIELFGVESFRFTVLSLHERKAQVNYTEVKEQFSRDVLYSKLPTGEYEYYNYCILSRYYRNKE